MMHYDVHPPPKKEKKINPKLELAQALSVAWQRIPHCLH